MPSQKNKKQKISTPISIFIVFFTFIFGYFLIFQSKAEKMPDYFVGVPLHKQVKVYKEDGSVYLIMTNPLVFSYASIEKNKDDKYVAYLSGMAYPHIKDSVFVYLDDVSFCSDIDSKSIENLNRDLIVGKWILHVEYRKYMFEDKVELVLNLNAGISPDLKIKYGCKDNIPYLIESNW